MGERGTEDGGLKREPQREGDLGSLNMIMYARYVQRTDLHPELVVEVSEAEELGPHPCAKEKGGGRVC